MPISGNGFLRPPPLRFLSVRFFCSVIALLVMWSSSCLVGNIHLLPILVAGISPDSMSL